MQKIFGLLVVLGCVFGGYFEAGGQLIAIWQPAEIIIIVGAGLGAMIIGKTFVWLTVAANRVQQSHQRRLFHILPVHNAGTLRRKLTHHFAHQR